MKLLDLFCGCGGASMGYARAGFEVTGVDIVRQPEYPFDFVEEDALDLLYHDEFLARFDVIHASPPCQFFSVVTPAKVRIEHADSLTPTRECLNEWGGVYVIENVPGAPFRDALMLCGASFNLGTVCRDGKYRPLKRHRLFESNTPIMGGGCCCDGREPVGVYGNGGGGYQHPDSSPGGYRAFTEEMRAALGIDWVRNRRALSQAIPPAYTEYIARQLLTFTELTEAAR